MKRIFQLSMCVLLMGGCASMNPLASLGWGSKTDETPTLANSQPANSAAGLPTPSQKTDSHIQQTAGVNTNNSTFPDTVNQHINVGQTEVAAWYRDNNDQHLAIAKTHFEEAVRQAPGNPDAHHGLAIIADLQQQYQLAELHYQKALSVNPNNGKVLGDMGYSYLLQGRLSEAESFLTRTIEVDATNKNAIKHLGDVYAQQGRTQLAKTTYMAVLSPDETQLAITENAKAPVANVASADEKQSFMERMLPKKKEELSATEEIRQLMVAERERRAEEIRENQPPATPNQQRMAQQRSNGNMPAYYSEEDRLKHELAKLDREQYRGTPHGPIVIDPQTGEHYPQGYGSQQTQQQYAQGQPGFAQQNNQPQNMNNQGYRQQPANSYQSGAAAQSQFYPQQASQTQSQFSQQPQFQNENPGNTPYFAQQPNQQQPGAMPQISPGETAQTQQPFQSQHNATNRSRTSNARQQPWQGIQPAAAELMAPAIDHVQHQQPATPAETNWPSTVPPQMGLQPQVARQNDASGRQNPVQQHQPTQNQQGEGSNAFEAASKEAARMGMGLGSGNAFPVFENHSTQHSPGSATSMSGNSFGTPHRFLPTDQPPQDLNQAYAPQPSTEFAPPPNSHGQQMPASAAPMFSQEQFGTASRFQPSSMTPIHGPQFQQGYGYQNSNHPSYDEQRQRVDNQLNSTVRQAWGQQPGSQAITPAGGAHQLAAPAVYGGVMTPHNAGPSQPPSWPHQNSQTQLNQQTNRPYSNSYQGNSNTPQQYSADVVVPPPYPGVVNNQRPHNYYPPQQQSNQPLNAPQRSLRQPTPNNDLPMIVPGNR